MPYAFYSGQKDFMTYNAPFPGKKHFIFYQKMIKCPEAATYFQVSWTSWNIAMLTFEIGQERTKFTQT